MATPTLLNPSTSFELTNGLIVSMDEVIYMYSPEELPLLNGMGTDGLSVVTTAPVDQVQFDTMDEENLAPRSVVSAAHTTGDTILTMAAGEHLRFSTGDVLMVRKANGDEVIKVTGYGTTTGTLLITRAYAGTATNYASGATVIGLGTALAEGSDPEEFRATDTVTRTNLTQIFGPTAISMSGTAQVVPRYGVPNQWAKQLGLRTYENAQAREQAFIYGKKTNSTTSKIRTTGGLVEQISTNVNTTSTQLTVANIVTQQQACFNEGGVPDILTVNPLALGDLNDISNTSIVRTDMMETMRGRYPVQSIITEFGQITIVRNRWIDKLDAIGWRRGQVRRRILRPLVYEALAKTGDADQGQIVCEEGLEVKGEKHCFRFSSLTSY